jgi:hypothetical protein
MPLHLLTQFLGFAAFAWGISVVGVFARWPQVNDLTQGTGPNPSLAPRLAALVS